MIKNDECSNERARILIEAFINSEVERFRKSINSSNISNVGYITKVFRYRHFGIRILDKVKALKNATITLQGHLGDSDIILRKGNAIKSKYIITIENNDICLKNI